MASLTAESRQPLFPFAFVGCWNQPGATEADDEATPRNAVAAAVTRQADIKHIVLGGDNVYARPIMLAGGKKNKKHEPAVFDAGLALYKASGKDVIGSFGNHNLDMLDHQMAAFGIDTTYYRREYTGRVHIVVLDTNIMNARAEQPADYMRMLEWFEMTVVTLPAGHQYYVIQHEPYFIARSKGFGEIVGGEPFLDIMFSIRAPIAILCADTHHYQHATIQRAEILSPVIHQFIVGTGGANRDPYMAEFIEHNFGKYLFKKVEEMPDRMSGLPSYGFLRVDGPDIAEMRFVPIQAGGQQRQQQRRTHRRVRRTVLRRHPRSTARNKRI